MWPIQPHHGGPQPPTVLPAGQVAPDQQLQQPLGPFDQLQQHAPFAGALGQVQQVSAPPPWRQPVQQLQYAVHPWPEPLAPQPPKQQQQPLFGQPQQFQFTTVPRPAGLQTEDFAHHHQHPGLGTSAQPQQHLGMVAYPAPDGRLDAAAAQPLLSAHDTQAQPKPQSKKARRRAAQKAAEAAKAADAAAARLEAKLSGKKRHKLEAPEATVVAAAAAAGMEQQVLKRPKRERADQLKEAYVSLLDLCLRKARLKMTRSSHRGSSISQGLLTVPQLRSLFNTAAQV